MQTTIIWFRNDLRIHDHPALRYASKNAKQVIPVFIFDKNILSGKHSGSNRNRFLVDSLQDLKKSLQKLGADLIIRQGNPGKELIKLAKNYNAQAVYYTADYSPYAIARDKNIENQLAHINVESRGFAGKLIVSSLPKIRTKSGGIYKVFTPFWRAWMQIERRELAKMPQKLTLPSNITLGELPKLNGIAKAGDLSKDVLKGGERAGRARLKTFLHSGIKTYHTQHNDLAADSTSRLSSYIHFGCLSTLEIESMLPPEVKGAAAWHRQLCWRDFYHYILLHFPANAYQEFQEQYRSLTWNSNKHLLTAWQNGQTGYPIVDAAMRQLHTQGWIHNRGRLIVACFLVKDLWIDWRLGETYFMKMLIDGDEANNNGNWQWIPSVGVDPAPVFRRMYNPMTQQARHDPSGQYVRKFVPELINVPNKFLCAPWTMPAEIQQEAHCIIGKDYPEPIVDHAQARLAALGKYQKSPAANKS